MKVSKEFIPESREYLHKFVSANYDSFTKDMNEYQPKMGYGEFPYSSKIVQCMRDITHVLSDSFTNIEIPENYPTPENLIETSNSFIEHLKTYKTYFDKSIEEIMKKDKEEGVSQPISVINDNREKTIIAFEKFVKMASIEQESTFNNVTILNIQLIENIFNKFHSVQKQLQIRRKEKKTPRPTLKINDEYDVQDLLHALLKIHFDDIRSEEWTPSHAGSSKRSDFLLKKEEIIIEVKKTRESLKDREIVEQLIIDKANYIKHPNCKTLICFIYDPDNFITNPKGIEDDLKETSSTFSTLVYIKP